MQDIDKLKQLVESSKRILITSHISPDPDALASVLLLGTTLKLNYPDKEILMILEEEPEGLEFLTGYKEVKFQSLIDALNSHKPDLFILLDAVNYERCSRNDGDAVRRYLRDNKVATAIIDHHEPTGKDDTDVYIYQGNIATVQDVYEACFKHLGLKKPEGYGDTTMLGIYSDSGGFTYANPHHRQTFKIVSDLIDDGVNLETIRSRLRRYTTDQLIALSEFARNVTTNGQYSYSYLGDEFVADWQKASRSVLSLNTAAAIFVDQFIRNIDGLNWGYIVYLNPLAGENMYSLSLRSQANAKDVSQIANKFGGGGHRPAAGAKIEAKSIQEALAKVKAAITTL